MYLYIVIIYTTIISNLYPIIILLNYYTYILLSLLFDTNTHTIIITILILIHHHYRYILLSLLYILILIHTLIPSGVYKYVVVPHSHYLGLVLVMPIANTRCQWAMPAVPSPLPTLTLSPVTWMTSIT